MGRVCMDGELVSIERSEDDQVSPAVIVIGLCLVVFGFLIYYFMPLALISFNLGLLLQVRRCVVCLFVCLSVGSLDCWKVGCVL